MESRTPSEERSDQQDPYRVEKRFAMVFASVLVLVLLFCVVHLWIMDA